MFFSEQFKKLTVYRKLRAFLINPTEADWKNDMILQKHIERMICNDPKI